MREAIVNRTKGMQIMPKTRNVVWVNVDKQNSRCHTMYNDRTGRLPIGTMPSPPKWGKASKHRVKSERAPSSVTSVLIKSRFFLLSLRGKHCLVNMSASAGTDSIDYISDKRTAAQISQSNWGNDHD